MSRGFAYRLLLHLIFGSLGFVVLTGGIYLLAHLAITDGAPRPDLRRLTQPAFPADREGHSVVMGPDATAIMFETDGSKLEIRGHNAPLVAARLVKEGSSLITVDADGDVRLTDVKTASWIGRAKSIFDFKLIREKLWTSYGKPLAQLSLAALAHLYAINFRDCEDCPEMVVVPAGKFIMGSPESEEKRSNDEGPQHEVRIAAPFAAGKLQIKRAEYASFVAATGYPDGDRCISEREASTADRSESWRDPGYEQADSHPAVCIGWEDAKAYAAWLSAKTSQTYRLLTEAEWEYAARAGANTPFWWGRSISTEQANYDGNYTYAGGPNGISRKKTLPANSFNPNPFGLYQMHGNIWEWVEDCWHESYDGALSDGSAWITNGCNLRVLRGGSFNNSPQDLRAARRNKLLQSRGNHFTGFRLARTLSPIS